MSEKQIKEQVAAIRRARREGIVQAMRDGRRQRAATFKDRRKEASRKACRKGQW